MLELINDKKEQIKNSLNIIEEEKKKVLASEQELVELIRKAYPIESLVGKKYFKHRSKWGHFVFEGFSPFLTSHVDYYSHMSIYGIFSGDMLEKIFCVDNSFDHNSNYLILVEYDTDSYGFEEGNLADIPLSDRFIYEYLVLEL